MKKKPTRLGIIMLVALLFALGALTAGIITYFTQRAASDSSVRAEVEQIAARSAEEVRLAVREFPANRWLMQYWYEHDGELDIEYDVDYGAGTRTEEKCRLLHERYPALELRYASEDQIAALAEADQKLYAEVAYSWLTTRINEIKRANRIDYLFCVLTDEACQTQYFLFSAADPGAKRGTEYLEVYPLGKEVSVAENESQQEAMRLARRDLGHLAAAGDYVDYYAYLDTVAGRPALIGLTYNLSDITENVRAQTLRGTAYAVAHQLLMALLCMALIYLFVLRPLKKVQENIRLYKNTKDSAAVAENLSAIRSRNEIGKLSKDVSDLAREMDDYLHRIETITAERERIGTELALASRIQDDMLPNVFPPFPDRTDFDIYASMDPAKEVGGDFYDFFMVDDSHLAIVIADVSDKGIPAALFMMASMLMIHQAAMVERSPAKVLASVNDQICANNREQMFVSVWLGVLDLETGVVTAANAGHEYPMVKQPDGHFELLRDKHGFVLGGMDGLSYSEYRLELRPDAKLFLYTDGLPEASKPDNVLFGLDRTLDALNAAGDGSPKQILDAVNAAVADYVGDARQFDDLTMLCVHYIGRKAAPVDF